MRPCAITSYGACNALGRDRDEVLGALFAGKIELAVGRPFPERSREGFVTPFGKVDLGTQDPFALPPTDQFPTRQAALTLRGIASVLNDARRVVERYGAERVALIVGTSTGGIEASERSYAAYLKGGSLPVGFSFADHHALDSAARLAATHTGARGPIFAVSTACSSSAKALASAARLLHAGWADAAIVGGVDSLCLLTLMGFAGLGIVDARGCRPFAADREGMNIGEGAAFLVMERDVSAAVYLVGAGETNDAFHMAHPHPDGAGAHSAIAEALRDAGLESDQVGYVNAHGTGTVANDAVEARVLAGHFGRTPLVSSTKGQTGHLLGASGATEALFCAAALELQRVPGNRGVGEPGLGINLCQHPSPHSFDYALSNSFAFGGSNAALLLATERGAARVAARGVETRPEWVTLAELVELRDLDPAASSLLSSRALGRASPLTRWFDALLSQLAARGVDVARVPQVFASANGEMHTTLELLALQARGETSPLRFQASVHNAAQGQLSIALGHRGFATSLSAGRDTTAMALVEAWGLLAAGHEDVVVLLAEEASPAPLSTAGYAPMGVGLHLQRAARPGAPLLALERRDRMDLESPLPPPAPPSLRDNPIGDAPRLAHATSRAVLGAPGRPRPGRVERATKLDCILPTPRRYRPRRSSRERDARVAGELSCWRLVRAA